MSGVDFEIPTETITVGKGSLTVRGMDSEDVVFLTTHYIEDLKATLTKYGKAKHLPKSRVADLVMDIIKDFPTMATEIISRCADVRTEDEVNKIRRLPFIKQVEAMKHIALLSSEDGADLKKVMGVVASLLEANGLSLGPLTQSLQNIIGTSESPSPS